MSDTTTAYAPGTHPDLPPPGSTVGVQGWVLKNLFSSPANQRMASTA